MGSSESDSSNGDNKKATSIGTTTDEMRYPRSDDSGQQFDMLPKRRKDSPNKLIKKRFRTEASDVPEETTLAEDDVKIPWVSSSTSTQPQQQPHPQQPQPPQVLAADAGLIPPQSAASLLGRNTYAEQIGIHGPSSLFNQVQASTSTAAAGAGGPYYSGFAESLYSGLSPAARQFVLRDQLVRSQQAAMLIAQMGGGTQPYDPLWNPVLLQQQQQAIAAMGDRTTAVVASQPLPRQNFPASDMISRYASVLSGLPVQTLQHQVEFWRGPSLPPGNADLADQYRLHHQLNQLSQQQQPTMSEHLHYQLSQISQQQRQLFASRPTRPSPDLRRFAAEQQHRFGQQPMRGLPESPSNNNNAASSQQEVSSSSSSSAVNGSGEVAGRRQQSPVSIFGSGSTASFRGTSTGEAAVATSQHAEQRLVPAASAAAASAAVFISRRTDGVGDDNTDDGIELPPCIEGTIPPLALRQTFPLGIDEDTNWLSEFHCFVRAELIEVFQASHDEVKSRNTSIVYNQIGIRCRHCAHLTGTAKAGRSSAFPSSIRQIYQSFTMMLRDHFPNCDSITGDVGDRYAMHKDKPSQGATDSKRYWIYAGLKIGMADSKQGIFMTKETRREGLASLPFGLDPDTPWRDDAFAHVSLVSPSDRGTVTEFLLLLVSQVQPIRLTEAECIGNRRSLRVGLPGFGCRYCCQQRRLGLGRMFPARRRTMPTKLLDFYDHIRRCPLCPESIKADLIAKNRFLGEKPIVDQGADREFFDRVWTALGNDTSPNS